MQITQRRYDQLVAYHERALQTLRDMAELFQSTNGAKRPTAGHVNAARRAALQADAKRRELLKTAVLTDRPAKGVSKTKKQRQASARFLARFDRMNPKSAAGRTTGVYVRRGYLERKGDGYIRTDKPYTV